MPQFRIDIDRLTVLLLPTFMRTAIVYALARAMVQPLSTLQGMFASHRASNLYNAGHNGQTCHLRGMLNDAFDPLLRRITIDDTERHEFMFVYHETDDKPLWAEKEPAAVLLVSERYATGEGVDFAATVPGDISIAARPQMVSMLNYYKLAGKRYTIRN